MANQQSGGSGSNSSNNKEASAAAGSAATEAEGDASKQKIGGKFDLALLNEDDDFEEFEAEEWDDMDPSIQTKKVWEDDWDDDMVEDDFSKELKAQLEMRGIKLETSVTNGSSSAHAAAPMES